MFDPRNRPLPDQARGLLPVIVALAVFTLVDPAVWCSSVSDTMRFAAEMALKGNWREASFRWERAASEMPDNPKILNNLAVATEALGNTDDAAQLYARAVIASGGDPVIEDNRQRFARFWTTVAGQEVEGMTEAPVTFADKSKKKKKKGKTARVTVGLPVPPQLELKGNEQVLIASFLGGNSELLDTNRELVRFLRSKFRRVGKLTILDVTPPPAVPEQTTADLVANREFWKYLGRNYDADLIVSGQVSYNREDASAFQDVDFVSTQTGQKVRETRFVEQEQFRYELDLFFIDGATGDLRFRDLLKRSVVFQGAQNDPIAAFYQISESIAMDVLAIVTRQVREDVRVIFKKI